MKGLILLIFTLFLLVTFQDNTAEAHSGRTDSNGGHNCSQKSISKGLCTGYHYHNGGSDTSSNGNTSSTPPSSQSSQPNDKDCSDFSSYEEVVAYWNRKGYTKDYDPERLDGFGNVVDDGIPCEAPSGYDTSNINGSPAQVAKEEKAAGEEEGYHAGLKDGYADKEKKDALDSGSEAYQEGYDTGYTKGYQEGKAKLKKEKQAAQQAGYDYGKEADQLKIPSAYNQHDALKAAFEEGYQKAVQEIIKQKEKALEAQGYEDGKNDVKELPQDAEKNFVEAYEKGFEEGQQALKQTYLDQGYQAAFQMVTYKQPDLAKEKYIAWYKEGFEANEEVLKIQDMAYENGLQGKELSVPEKYKDAKKVYTHYHQIGIAEYEEKQEKENTRNLMGLGVIVLGWLGRRMYVAKKMIA
ncbi:YHYH domain-containing protein [Thalassobacillus pellis]|uniref:YHYH domain-containing protein n=1 Tax=Thalassobacillus pellis TaxID=748008 RepID=UPI0019619B82|nr:YHYH domain-containing protein [Thalassobacillus pellis]MBM7554441.1 hypothetical protein [Thalassobacillus pellis]